MNRIQPLPWIVELSDIVNDDNLREINILDSDGDVVCTLYHDEMDPEHSCGVANAEMIVAVLNSRELQ